MTPRKLLALLLTLLLVLSLAACGGDDPAPSGSDPVGGNENVEQDGEEENEGEIPEDLKGYLATRTGKFYSQFSGESMYMKYEAEMEGHPITMISARSGDKSYSETLIGDMSSGISIMEGNTMYTIDHSSKMVMKMTMTADPETMVTDMASEFVGEDSEEPDMANLKTGTRIIDGKTYETEEWIMDDAASIMCFDGDNLAYMIGVFESEEMVLKVVEITDQVDESLFHIPADYTVYEM